MNESILQSIKKLLGIDEFYDHFDQDILIHINTALATLTQLGVGPEEGYTIQDGVSTWEDFLGQDSWRFEAAKTYVYLKVRMVFDPPTSSAASESFNRTINELEWRLNVAAENR